MLRAVVDGTKCCTKAIRSNPTAYRYLSVSSAVQNRTWLIITLIIVDLQKDCIYEKARQTHNSPISISEAVAPNGKSVFIKSFGCSHNMSDGEYMGGILQHGGYTIVHDKDRADVWYV